MQDSSTKKKKYPMADFVPTGTYDPSTVATGFTNLKEGSTTLNLAGNHIQRFNDVIDRGRKNQKGGNVMVGLTPDDKVEATTLLDDLKRLSLENPELSNDKMFIEHLHKHRKIFGLKD